MENVKAVACVLLLCLVIVRSQLHEKRDRGAFDGPGRPDRGQVDFQPLNKLRRTQGEGRDDPEYKRYLQELMANNPDFAKRFGSNSPDDIAKRFANLRGMAPNGVRSHLDENERKTVEELKELHRARMLQQAIGDGQLPPLRGQKPLGGYDPRVAMDLMRNKRVTPDGGPVNIQDKMQEFRRKQEELDKQRQTDFKKHEMQIEHLRRRKLKEMDEVQRLKEEERLRQVFEERRKHQPLVHPASREQLEDVWQKHDGFKDETFNAKTFFNLHDMNGDGQLDIYEVEALFRRELEKVYRGRMNTAEAMEDLLEMRQHVFSEVDRDQDGLLSLAEFLIYTDRDIFNVKEEWKPVIDRNNEDIFSDKEMEDYEEDYEENEDYDYDYDTYGNIIRNPKQHQQEQQQRQKVEHEQQQDKQQQQQGHRVQQQQQQVHQEQQQQVHQEQQQQLHLEQQQQEQDKPHDQQQQQQEQEQKQAQPSLEEQLQQQEMLLKRLKELQQNPQQGLDQQQLEEYRRKLMQMQAEVQQQQQQSQDPKQPDSEQKTTTSDTGDQAPVKEENKQDTQQDGMWKGQAMPDPVAGNQQL